MKKEFSVLSVVDARIFAHLLYIPLTIYLKNHKAKPEMFVSFFISNFMCKFLIKKLVIINILSLFKIYNVIGKKGMSI